MKIQPFSPFLGIFYILMSDVRNLPDHGPQMIIGCALFLYGLFLCSLPLVIKTQYKNE